MPKLFVFILYRLTHEDKNILYYSFIVNYVTYTYNTPKICFIGKVQTIKVNYGYLIYNDDENRYS